MYRLNNITLPITYKKEELLKEVSNRLNIKENKINNLKILKQSIDARHKDKIMYVFSVIFDCSDKLNIDTFNDELELNINKIDYKGKRPIIVGSGPSGLFCAYALSKCGLNPIILEQGKCVVERQRDVEKFWETSILDVKSNVQFGFGGAGTFSDGKVNSGISGDYTRFILNEFVKNGAEDEILYSSTPHIGTDVLVKVIENIKNEIISMGGEFLFEHKMINFEAIDNKITKIIVDFNGKNIEYETDKLILCIGHSSRDTFITLKNNNVKLEQKPLSIGLRIQHKQEDISKSLYGDSYKLLPPASYKLSTFLDNGRCVYTFCDCPGGYVVNASSDNFKVVCNGMSYSKRDAENSNCAILVNVDTKDFNSDDPLGGMYYQEQFEKSAFNFSGTYKLPVQLLSDFLIGKISTEFKSISPCIKGEYVFANLNDCLPKFASDSIKKALPIFDKKIKGFNNPDAILVGVETRSSSPVRIVRDENYLTNIIGLYSCGEGAGYAGGIMSASVDGIKVALSIIQNLKTA